MAAIFIDSSISLAQHQRASTRPALPPFAQTVKRPNPKMPKKNTDSEPPVTSKDTPSPAVGPSSPPPTGSEADREQNAPGTPSVISVARDSSSGVPGTSDRRSELAFPASALAMEFHEPSPTDVTTAEEAEIDLSMQAWG